MRKLLLITMAALLCGSATYAQNPTVKTTSDFSPCIGSLTKSGKGTLVAFNKNEEDGVATVSVYNDQMKVAKTFNADLQRRIYHTWHETGTVIPTGFSYAFYSVDYNYNYTTDEYEYSESFQGEPYSAYNEGMDFSGVTTPEQLVQKLIDAGILAAWDSPYPFTDFKENLAFMLHGSNSNFYFYDCFGAKYPTNTFYTLIDGKIYQVSGGSHNYGNLQYSTDNVVWTVDESSVEERTKGGNLVQADYEDFDDSKFVAGYFTQTLFNDDDKWEYLVNDYEIIPLPEEDKWIVSTQSNGDGTITITRGAGETYNFLGYAVYNEDSEKLYSFNVRGEDLDIYHLAGKDYIAGQIKDKNDGKYYEVLYEIDKPTTSIREVARTKSSRVKAEENAVIVEVGDELAGSDVMVADMAGKLVGKGRIEKGNNSTRIAMPTHTPGVYVISLRHRNKVAESRKMMIK